MKTVYPVLYEKMREHDISFEELAAVINVNRFTFLLKMLGIKQWKLTEVVSICCFFRTHNVEHLFCKKSICSLFGFCTKTF